MFRFWFKREAKRNDRRRRRPAAYHRLAGHAAGVPVFRDLSDDSITELCRGIETIRVKQGAAIIREGEEATFSRCGCRQGKRHAPVRGAGTAGDRRQRQSGGPY